VTTQYRSILPSHFNKAALLDETQEPPTSKVEVRQAIRTFLEPIGLGECRGSERVGASNTAQLTKKRSWGHGACARSCTDIISFVLVNISIVLCCLVVAEHVDYY
jgi:hypothetical protein